MRYAMINEGLDTSAHFGNFQPAAGRTAFSQEAGTRFSDEQLYALALYIYSLRAPVNPSPIDDGPVRLPTAGLPRVPHAAYYNNNNTPAATCLVQECVRPYGAGRHSGRMV